MQLTRNVKAISGLSLILVLLASAIIGALFSYLWVVGYYENLRIRVPEKSAVTITEVTFSPQNTRFFNVTVLNPSYSLSEYANITRITTSTEDAKIHSVLDIDPPLPFKLSKATMDFAGNQTFKCTWNWANYTGESIGIVAFLAEGSGPTFQAEAPLVDLSITDINFNPSVSVTRFNMTVKNSNTSIREVDVAEIRVTAEDGAFERVSEVTPALPYTLHPNDSVPLMCSWDWTEYQGENVTIVVETTQGYLAYYPKPPERTSLPSPTDIQVADVLFNVAKTTSFNVTVRNDETSPTYVNITGITVAVANETFSDLPVTGPPSLPYALHPGAKVTFKCMWNWTEHREEVVEVSVHTLQNFTESRVTSTAGNVVLTITNAAFDVTDTDHFNFTVQNSRFSLEEYVKITSISLNTVEDSWLVTNTDPDYADYTLYSGSSVTFKCEWDWKNYRSKQVNLTVLAQIQNKSYYADFSTTTPAAVILNITQVIFDLSDTEHFNVTIENSEFSLDYVFVMNITAASEEGAAQNVPVVPVRSLPHVLYPTELKSFVCRWDWTDYEGQNITITAHTLQGYTAYAFEVVPDRVLLEIIDVFFNETDTTHFNITIGSSEFSLIEVNITSITINVDGIQNVTEARPALPHPLKPGTTLAFRCSWNWTDYQGQTIRITIRTSRGYAASAEYTIPALSPSTKTG